MTQLTIPNPQDLQGQILFDVSDRQVGVIKGVYLDNATRSPEWAAVRLGPGALALVPLAEASAVRGGVRVDYELAKVADAPFRLTTLDNEVTESTEQLLHRYYEGGDDSSPAVVEEASEVLDTAKSEATEMAATAKDEAARVAATATGEAAAVVEVAKEETAEVAHLAVAEAQEMLDTTRSELESQAEIQIEQIAESLHRLAGQALALARGNADQAGPLGEFVGRAGQELRTVAGGIEERGSSGLLSDAQRAVRQRPRAAIIGTAAAIVAGARLMGTPAGDRLKERLAPLKGAATEAGRSVADELKPIAQHRAEQVKAVATSAVDQVKQDTQGTVDDVKGTATRSAKAVRGTARRSASTVKGTAAQSKSTVKTTAKRTARAATPVG